MNKTKFEKGITLIVLIITIVVLLILAAVAIGAVKESGIIGYAQDAKNEYETGKIDEGNKLAEYETLIATRISANTIAEAQEDNMLIKEVNSIITDLYNNKITIPAGFKILVDDTTEYTAENIDVTKGIVITDGTNEFVWVPVGENITNETKTATITLGRYLDFTANEKGEYIPIQTATDYKKKTPMGKTNFTEDTVENHNSNYKNAIAKDIGAFVTSTINNGGYYIARFEAGKKEEKILSKYNEEVWLNVRHNEAAVLCRNMYTNKLYTSDLINSYAWDTAIIFIQLFSTEEDASLYASLNKGANFSNTGINKDKYCNIYDMSGNVHEWTTETSDNKIYNCVYRGGSFTGHYTSYRYGINTTDYGKWFSFRPILYID